MTEIESWRELADDRIEFVMRRCRPPTDPNRRNKSKIQRNKNQIQRNKIQAPAQQNPSQAQQNQNDPFQYNQYFSITYANRSANVTGLRALRKAAKPSN
jgi:hypothetical protein